MIGSFDCASSHDSKFKTVTLQSSFWNVFTHRASSNFAQNAYCSREIYLQCSLQHHRSVKLAAKLNSSGCHCSKITRAFLRKEYCFSSLTRQGGAKKTNDVSAFYAMRNKGPLRTFDLGDVSSSSLPPFRFCLLVDFSALPAEHREENGLKIFNTT